MTGRSAEFKLPYRVYVYDANISEQHPFVPDEIARISDVYTGVYLLISLNDTNQSVVIYVGRGQIRRRLLNHLRDLEKGSAWFFRFWILNDEDAEFMEECRLYHLYGENFTLLNEKHPPVPAGAQHLICPYPACRDKY
jgi:hypothetical protein